MAAAKLTHFLAHTDWSKMLDKTQTLQNNIMDKVCDSRIKSYKNDLDKCMTDNSKYHRKYKKAKKSLKRHNKKRTHSKSKKSKKNIQKFKPKKKKI